MLIFDAPIKLSDGTKKALIIFFLIFIILFVLIGFISIAIQNVMKRQGSKADGMLANVVKADYFDTEKKFRRFAFKKNARVFYLESKIPFLILLGSWIAYLIFCLFSGKWGYNPLNKTDGFATLFFKFSEWPKTKVFGITIVSGWPTVLERPHFVVQALFSYFFVPANLVGIIWFLICTQGFIARSLRIRKLARGIYRKNLIPDTEPNLLETDK